MKHSLGGPHAQLSITYLLALGGHEADCGAGVGLWEACGCESCQSVCLDMTMISWIESEAVPEERSD